TSCGRRVGRRAAAKGCASSDAITSVVRMTLERVTRPSLRTDGVARELIGYAQRPAGSPPPAAHGARALQRLQKRDDLVLLGGGQRAVVAGDAGGFSGVTEDRFVERQRRAVVHVSVVRPHTPERHGPQLVGGRLPSVLHDAV